MKKGISLIVLVITIIVMIILAASVVITLSNTGIIDRAAHAVDLTNQKQVQDLASLLWAEAYMDENRTDTIENIVKNALKEEGITEDKWDIEVSDSGVTVTNKELALKAGLGGMITTADYGKTVDYSVTVDGKAYSNWKIFYHNNEYIFLIASKSIGLVKLDKGTTVASLTEDELKLYEKFTLNSSDKYVLADKKGSETLYNNQGVAQLIKDYTNFANTKDYGKNVVGAIGGPTLELITSALNAKGHTTPPIAISTNEYGYKINDGLYIYPASENFYMPPTYYYWLASPSARNATNVIYSGRSSISYVSYLSELDVHPVVCLKASIPATVGTTTDFSLIK